MNSPADSKLLPVGTVARLARLLPTKVLDVMNDAELLHWLEVLESPRLFGEPTLRRESVTERGHEALMLPWSSGKHRSRGWAIVAMLGKPRSGKDAVADLLVESYHNVKRVAFSDSIIDECNYFLSRWHDQPSCNHGINEENKSHPMFRRLLQDWGVIRRRSNGELYWAARALTSANEKGQQGGELVVVTGARSVGDIKIAAEHKAAVWKVVRPSLAGAHDGDHEIETMLDHVPDGMWDGLIINHENDFVGLGLQAKALVKHGPRLAYYPFLVPGEDEFKQTADTVARLMPLGK